MFKKIAIAIGVVVLTSIWFLDFKFESACGGYQYSDYTKELGERGDQCWYSLTVKKVEERYQVKFLDEWTIE